MKKSLFLLALPVTALQISVAAQTVVIHPDSVIKRNMRGAAGVNIVYPLDNGKYYPRKVPIAIALKNIGVGAMRFSEGHLADNYLWTVPPYEDAVKGLKPRVATLEVEPANWDWMVDKDGFIHKSLDFDDFIALCREVGAEPIITVNLQSYTYKGGPAKEFLINSAKEWVKYANVVRKYGVKYWQLGNEVEKYDTEKDTKPEKQLFLKQTMDLDDFCDMYGRMAKAMKEVDPSIMIGPGVMSAPSWNKAILERFPELTSFISCHQYTWGAPFCPQGYAGWAAYKEIPIPNVRKMQALLDSNPAWKNIQIVITETGSTGGSWPEKLDQQDGDKRDKGRYVNDLYKALNNWEMLTGELATPAVKFLTVWCTRTPWRGPTPTVGIESQLDPDNNPTPTGDINMLINTYMLPDMLAMKYTQGNLRLRASASPDKKQLTLFVLNKGDQNEQVDFSVASPYNVVERIEFSGKSPNDRHPTVKKVPVDISDVSVAGGGNAQSATVPPCSLTIFRFAAGAK